MCIRRHTRLTVHSTKWEQPFLVAQTVKNLPAMQETQVLCLGWEYPLEREFLPTQVFWKIPWTEELAGYSL